MKNPLLFVMLFLMSSVGYLQAQQCPITVGISTDNGCLFVTFDESQTAVDSFVVNDTSVYYLDSTTAEGLAFYAIDTASTCDTTGMVAFVGSLTSITGLDTVNCEFDGGVFQPPCPNSAFAGFTDNCLRLVYEGASTIELPDSLLVDGTTYYPSSESMIYTDDGSDCLDETVNPFGGRITIGPSICDYEEALLPISILSFDFENSDGEVELSWEVNSEEPTRQLYLQKSYDGVDWMTVYEQNLQNFSTGQTMDGQFTDHSIDKPRLFYRLYISGVSGETKYSNILPVTLEDKVINNLFFQSQSRTIMIKAGQNFTGEMHLFNTQGQNVMTKQVQMQKNTYQEIDVKGHLTPGIYFVKFDNALIPPTKIFID